MEISAPKADEFEAYYDLRWRILRAPWDKPKGSEKDWLEEKAIHVIAKEGDKMIGCGRLHFNSSEEAQIRFMAVEEGFRGKGVGWAILEELEKKARERGSTRIFLNSRDTSVRFYKKHGYRVVERAHTLFGKIAHVRMEKEL